MSSYSEIRKHCEQSHKLSEAVIDDFLIYYAAGKERLEPVMNAALKKYKAATRDIPQSYLNILKSEYIAHKIFKKDGFLSKYMDRTELKNLPPEQYEYLKFQLDHPWRFSFAKIKSQPADNFFEMKDVMSGENYLLYSPGMQATLESSNPLLWFNLIADNGQCWQTFGLIIPFRAFGIDDIFFFATELNRNIEDEDMLMEEVERNPFPFFMLLSASKMPVVVSKGYEVLICQAIDPVEKFTTDEISVHFEVNWNKDVYQLVPKKISGFPHMAAAYYHEKKGELVRFAMTTFGFEKLTEALARAGYVLDEDAEIVVSQPMLYTAERVLGKRIVLNPYESYFEKQKTPEESENMQRINHFIGQVISAYNDGQEPDIDKLARESGMNLEEAAALWKQLKQKFSGRL